MFQLRPAERSDADFLLALHHVALRPYVEPIWGWDQALQDTLFRERLDLSRVSIIVYEGKEVGQTTVEYRSHDVFLANILIHPDYQNKGIGSAVLDKILHETDAAGKPVSLTVLKNSPARRFYEHHGFSITKVDDVHFFMMRPNQPPADGTDASIQSDRP